MRQAARGATGSAGSNFASNPFPPDWRAIVVLHYFLGMPLPDVASSLGIPLGTAKSRLHRAIGVLRTTVAHGAELDSASMPEGRFA